MRDSSSSPSSKTFCSNAQTTLKHETENFSHQLKLFLLGVFGFQPTLQYPDPRPNSHFPALQTLPLPTRLPLPHKLPWHWLPRAHPTKHINALTTLASGAHGGKLGGITPVFAPQLLSITPNFAPIYCQLAPISTSI